MSRLNLLIEQSSLGRTEPGCSNIENISILFLQLPYVFNHCLVYSMFF